MEAHGIEGSLTNYILDFIKMSIQNSPAGLYSARGHFKQFHSAGCNDVQFQSPCVNQMIPMPFSTESITAAAITEPTWPPVLAPMACMRRKFLGLYFCPSFWTTLADM